MSDDIKFSSCERVTQRPKHRALTGFCRKNWTSGTERLRQIFYNCDVKPYFGALPPELRARVSREDVADVTKQFRDKLENFLLLNVWTIKEQEKDTVFNLSEIGALFGTSCVLEMRGVLMCGVSPWEGLTGIVCKMSFPEINACYALKVYKSDFENYSQHGPWFEIPTAFAATKAKPKNNNPVYMASLIYGKYLLTKWAGEYDDDKPIEQSMNSVFAISDKENNGRNLRAGHIIDWGETGVTDYGRLSYRGRKIVRQVVASGSSNQYEKLCKNNFERQERKQVMQYLQYYNLCFKNMNVQKFLANQQVR